MQLTATVPFDADSLTYSNVMRIECEIYTDSFIDEETSEFDEAGYREYQERVIANLERQFPRAGIWYDSCSSDWAQRFGPAVYDHDGERFPTDSPEHLAVCSIIDEYPYA